MNRIDWITSLSEKKPSPALVAGMLVAISVMAGVIVYQNNSIKSAAEEKALALKEQAAEFRVEVKEVKLELMASRRETKDCNDIVVSRTDKFADVMTQNYQKQINEAKRIDRERDRLYRERAKYRVKDAQNLEELRSKTVNSQNDEN